MKLSLSGKHESKKARKQDSEIPDWLSGGESEFATHQDHKPLQVRIPGGIVIRIISLSRKGYPEG